MNLIAADTDEEALKLSTSLQQYHLNITRNNRGPLEPPVDNLEKICSDFEKAILQQKLRLSFIGSPKTIKEQLESFIEQTQVDEIMFNGQIFDHQSRLHSFEIAAQLMKG